MPIDAKFKTPGQLIAHLLETRDWTQTFLASMLNINVTVVNKMISGTRPVDAEMSLRLGETFNIEPERFLKLQQAYDLAKARITTIPDPTRALRAQLYAELPINEMIRRGWLNVENNTDFESVEKALTDFFHADSLDEIEVLPHAAKKTQATTPITPVQMAWLNRVQDIANEILVPVPYSEFGGRKALKEINNLIYAEGEARKVPRILSDNGIRFVIVETLPAAKIDGVCFWLDEKSPVIGMTLRFDRIDNFWFVLRHEIEHVLQKHGQNAIVLDTELEGNRAGIGDDIEEEERIANAAAAEFCVPQKKLDKFISVKAPFFAERDFLGFAKTLKIHPGIVAGQLQHKTGRYDRFRSHQVKIRSIIAPSAVVDGWGDVYPVLSSGS